MMPWPLPALLAWALHRLAFGPPRSRRFGAPALVIFFMPSLIRLAVSVLTPAPVLAVVGLLRLRG